MFRLYVGIATLFVAMFPGVAVAGFLEEFSGHSVMILPGDTGDGIVNFAVYETEDSDWTNDAIFGGDGSIFTPLKNGSTNTIDVIDKDAKYVYFYQVVNSEPGVVESSLNSLYVAGPQFFTSHGAANGYVFVDVNPPTDPSGTISPVGPAGNQKLGGNADGDNDDNETVVGDASPSEKDAILSVPAFEKSESLDPMNITAYNSPVLFNNGGVVGEETSALQFQFNAIFTGEYTSIMFATSDTIPKYLPGEIDDGTHTEGDIPAPSPEPGAWVLILSGFPAVAALWVRRRRNVSRV